MDTIRNYLETMFANLPNTEAVRRAKRELLQMMEDKYNELRAEGRSENDAVGTVISEFGNLEELADDLGLEEEVRTGYELMESAPRRQISMDEAKDYLRFAAQRALAIALAVALCILCVVGPVIGSVGGSIGEKLGLMMMFVMIAVAVGIFIIVGMTGGRWKFLKKELCSIDYATANYIHDEKERYRINYAVQLTVGILMCVVCWMPAAFVEDLSFLGGKFADMFGATMLFLLIAVGVFLIVHSSIVMGSFGVLLKLNDRTTVSGRYVPEQQEEYASEGAEVLMRLYWPTVRCIYLIWSFLTFAWWKTWVIWPVAAGVRAIIKSLLKKSEEV